MNSYTPEDVTLADPIFDAWRLPELTPAAFRELGSGPVPNLQQLRYLAGFALLAPTSHNTVPQRLALSALDGAIDVFVSTSDILPESDCKGRQALVSVGCAIANLELAAAALELDVHVTTRDVAGSELIATKGESIAALVQLARVGFRARTGVAGEPSAPWLRLMLAHKVVRAEYDRTLPLGAELSAMLPGLVAEVDPKLRLHLIDQSLALRGLGKFQEQADRYVLENPRFAKELGHWLLPNDERSNGRAMRGYEFGFDDAFAKAVHGGLLGESALLPDQIAAFARGGRAGLESSAAVLVITTDGDDSQARINAGRAGHRLSLWLQQHGFASAFHAALTEVEWVSKMFAATVLRTTRRPMLLLRVGRVKRAADSQRPHAARPHLDAILVPSALHPLT